MRDSQRGVLRDVVVPIEASNVTKRPRRAIADRAHTKTYASRDAFVSQERCCCFASSLKRCRCISTGSQTFTLPADVPPPELVREAHVQHVRPPRGRVRARVWETERARDARRERASARVDGTPRSGSTKNGNGESSESSTCERPSSSGLTICSYRFSVYASAAARATFGRRATFSFPPVHLGGERERRAERERGTKRARAPGARQASRRLCVCRTRGRMNAPSASTERRRKVRQPVSSATRFRERDALRSRVKKRLRSCFGARAVGTVVRGKRNVNARFEIRPRPSLLGGMREERTTACVGVRVHGEHLRERRHQARDRMEQHCIRCRVARHYTGSRRQNGRKRKSAATRPGRSRARWSPRRNSEGPCAHTHRFAPSTRAACPADQQATPGSPPSAGARCPASARTKTPARGNSGARPSRQAGGLPARSAAAFAPRALAASRPARAPSPREATGAARRRETGDAVRRARARRRVPADARAQGTSRTFSGAGPVVVDEDASVTTRGTRTTRVLGAPRRSPAGPPHRTRCAMPGTRATRRTSCPARWS